MRLHGTRAKYVAEKCRCEPCTDANRRYQRERDRHTRRVAYGIEAPRTAYIDATEARDHLRWLSSVGVGRTQVHLRTGIAISSIDKIRTGQRRKARPATIEAILAVGRSHVADGTLIDARTTWRKINDLKRAGYSQAWIARQLGSTAVNPALQVGKRKVTAGTARKIAALHERLLFRVLEERRQTAERQRKHRAKEAA